MHKLNPFCNSKATFMVSRCRSNCSKSQQCTVCKYVNLHFLFCHCLFCTFSIMKISSDYNRSYLIKWCCTHSLLNFLSDTVQPLKPNDLRKFVPRGNKNWNAHVAHEIWQSQQSCQYSIFLQLYTGHYLETIYLAFCRHTRPQEALFGNTGELN